MGETFRKQAVSKQETEYDFPECRKDPANEIQTLGNMPKGMV